MDVAVSSSAVDAPEATRTAQANLSTYRAGVCARQVHSDLSAFQLNNRAWPTSRLGLAQTEFQHSAFETLGRPNWKCESYSADDHQHTDSEAQNPGPFGQPEADQAKVGGPRHLRERRHRQADSSRRRLFVNARNGSAPGHSIGLAGGLWPRGGECPIPGAIPTSATGADPH